MIDLSINFAGLKLKNPIIIGSSGLTETINGIRELGENGAAAVVLKSLFEEEILKEMSSSLSRMSSEGFVYPEVYDYFESQNNNKESSKKYLNLVSETKSSCHIPVIASINCITPSQWVYFPKQIEDAGADALELNLFILPSDFNRTAGQNEKVYFEIVSQVLSKIKIPVIVKLSYYFSNLGKFLQDMSITGIKGMVLFNKFYNPDFDLETLEITSGGTLSNPSDYYMPLRWTSIMYGRVGCDLAASTGIHDGNTVIKQILAGSTAVEIASVIYKNGSSYLITMLNEIERWMAEKGFDSIEGFRGKLSQHENTNPAAFERIQFMKYFRGYKG